MPLFEICRLFVEKETLLFTLNIFCLLKLSYQELSSAIRHKEKVEKIEERKRVWGLKTSKRISEGLTGKIKLRKWKWKLA